jgi:hypothetical protein
LRSAKSRSSGAFEEASDLVQRKTQVRNRPVEPVPAESRIRHKPSPKTANAEIKKVPSTDKSLKRKGKSLLDENSSTSANSEDLSVSCTRFDEEGGSRHKKRVLPVKMKRKTVVLSDVLVSTDGVENDHILSKVDEQRSPFSEEDIFSPRPRKRFLQESQGFDVEELRLNEYIRSKLGDLCHKVLDRLNETDEDRLDENACDTNDIPVLVPESQGFDVNFEHSMLILSMI